MERATPSSSSLTGYNVEGTDGPVGVIADADYDLLAGYLVIDTGPWIFGRKLLVPTTLVEHVDEDGETIRLDRTRLEIEQAPEVGELAYLSDTYREEIDSYFGGPPRP